VSLRGLEALQIAQRPFENLPEKRDLAGESLTEKRTNVAGYPALICQIAFVEWAEAAHLRHCTFVAMRDDKKPTEVVRET
jgi:bifunctional non-homologous end joining protein LigD